MPSFQKYRQSLRQLYRYVALAFRASPGWSAVSVGCTLAQSVFPVGLLYSLKCLVDGSVAAAQHHTSMGAAIGGPLTAFAALSVGQITLRAMGTIAQDEQSARVSESVQETLHRKSVELDLEFYESPAFRDTLHRAQQEAPHRPAQIVRSLTQVLQSAILLVAIGWLLAAFTPPWLMLCLGLTTVPAYLLRVRNSRRLHEWRRDSAAEERQAEYYHWTLTSTAFAKEMRLFGLGPRIAGLYADIRRSLTGKRVSLARRQALAEAGVGLLAVTALAGALAWMAFRTVSGLLSIGALVMQFQALQRGLLTLQELVSGLNGLYEHQLFMDRFDEFLALSSKAPAPRNPRPAPFPMREGIRFEDVSFSYPDRDKKVLDSINLHLAPGEMVALVGENGAGKSTLVKLLTGLYQPTAGRITIDGVDLRDIPQDEWWQQVSVLFQDYNHHCATAAENIWYGNLRKGAEPFLVQQAAEMAGADAFIAKLPLGYEQPLTRLFKNGAELSIGQWQKIALARTFFRDAPLVILDEPTSALDVNAEREVFEHFKTLTAGRTSLIISHRLSTVKMADRILLIDQGGVIESGSHEELLAEAGLYADLFETQASMYR